MTMQSLDVGALAQLVAQERGRGGWVEVRVHLVLGRHTHPTVPALIETEVERNFRVNVNPEPV